MADTLMTEGSYRRKIIGFAIPVFLGQLFAQLYNVIDSLIVGRFVGSAALAAVSSSGNLIFLVTGFFEGMSIGASVVIAQHIGAKRQDMIEKSVHTAVALALISSVLLSVTGLVLAPPVLRWMGTPETVMPESLVYFRILFGGGTGMVLASIFNSILRAAGDSRHPLIFLVCASLLNVALDLCFIVVLDWGVAGAATATVMSQFFSAFLAMGYLMRSREAYRFVPSKIRISVPVLLRIIRFGLPSGLQGSMISISNVLIQSFVNYFGEMAMAGIGAYSKLEGFAFLPTVCFSMAMTTFIGQNVGAGNRKRTKDGIRFGLLCTLVSAEVIGLLLWIFAKPMIALFDETPEVVFYGVQRARVTSLFFCLVAYTHVMSAVIRGLGRSVTPMVVMMLCWCAVRVVVLAVTAPFFHSIQLTHWIYPATWGLSSLVYFFYYRHMNVDKLGIWGENQNPA